MLLQRTAKSDIWSERNPRRLTRLKLAAGRRHHHYTTTAHVGGRVGGHVGGHVANHVANRVANHVANHPTHFPEKNEKYEQKIAVTSFTRSLHR